MDFLELAKARYSVRSFTPDPVPQTDIDRILEAGRVAPTACNKQPQKIIAVRSPKGLARLRECTPCHFHAPLAFIICCDRTACWQRSFDGKRSSDIDAAIVTTHMMLQAANCGIGSTWVMNFDPAATRAQFSLSDDTEPVAMLVMGYAAEDGRPSERHGIRKSNEELVTFA